MSLSGPDDVFLSTSLASYLDKKLLVLLRDGRKLLGILRSFDQFANAVLEGACERVIVGDLYCDIPLGLYVIRGENVVLIGELELDRKELPDHMISVSAAEIKKEMGARVFFVVVMGAQPSSPHASLGEIQLSLDLWVSCHVRTIIWLSTTSEMEPEIIMRRAKHRKQRGMPQI